MRTRPRIVAILLSVLACSTLAMPSEAEAGGPWFNYTDCAKQVDSFLTSLNPNVTHGYTQLIGGGVPCYSMSTGISVNLFGTIYSTGTSCVPGGTGKLQWTWPLYGNPSTVTTSWAPPGPDCSQNRTYFE